MEKEYIDHVYPAEDDSKLTPIVQAISLFLVF